jgi:hypothetical protein
MGRPGADIGATGVPLWVPAVLIPASRALQRASSRPLLPCPCLWLARFWQLLAARAAAALPGRARGCRLPPPGPPGTLGWRAPPRSASAARTQERASANSTARASAARIRAPSPSRTSSCARGCEPPSRRAQSGSAPRGRLGLQETQRRGRGAHRPARAAASTVLAAGSCAAPRRAHQRRQAAQRAAFGYALPLEHGGAGGERRLLHSCTQPPARERCSSRGAFARWPAASRRALSRKRTRLFSFRTCVSEGGGAARSAAEAGCRFSLAACRCVLRARRSFAMLRPATARYVFTRCCCTRRVRGLRWRWRPRCSLEVPIESLWPASPFRRSKISFPFRPVFSQLPARPARAPRPLVAAWWWAGGWRTKCAGGETAPRDPRST